MKIQSINKRSIGRLRNAFMDYLTDKGIPFHTIGLTEEDGKFTLFFGSNQTERFHVFEFEAEKCIGLEPALIAKEIIEPMLPRLKETLA